MTSEEAQKYAGDMTYRDAIFNLLKARCIPYRKATFIKVHELLKELEQKPSDGLGEKIEPIIRNNQKKDSWDIDETIKHAEEVANANERLCETVNPAMQLSDYGKCAEEHRQLAEWLKDYKRLKEREPCDDAISRQAVLDAIEDDNRNGHYSCFASNNDAQCFKGVIGELPSVNPQEPKTGHWIEKEGFDGDTYYDCSECGESFCLIAGTPTDNLYNYCPNCGAKMQEVEEAREEARARWICCPMCDKKKCKREADDCDVNIYLKSKARQKVRISNDKRTTR